MKYANALIGASVVLVIVSSVVRIFHIGNENNLLLIFSLIIGFAAQAWKIRLLEKQIKKSN